MSDRERFGELLADACLSGSQVDRLFAHYQLLIRWNKTLNLTRIVTLEEAVVRHYRESLLLHRWIPSDAASLMDVGSGGGFPGIPLAVARPEARVYLLESHQRKAVFLREATRGWENVTVLNERVEGCEQPAEWLVARAVNWHEITAQVPRLSRRVGLLLGEEDLHAALNASGLLWQEPVQLESSERRYLLVGTSV